MTEDPIQTELAKLQTALAGLLAQRAVLGDAVIEPALALLRSKIAEIESQHPLPPTASDERRIVTIMFSDIVNSTALAENLDPEDWHDIAAAVHTLVGGIIEQHDGRVLQYQGDGVLAIFGVPVTTERDPENAIRAGLAIQVSLPTLQTSVPIKMRVGIHTGLALVGEIGSQLKREYTAMGDTVNVAARLQSAAPHGGVLISYDTYRYVRGVFHMTAQPPLMVKGKSEPIQTYVVQRAKPRPFRTVTRGVVGIEAPTIGRDEEIQRLWSVADDAFNQRSFAWAQISGEAGMGKSRLLSDMADRLDLREETFRWLRGRAFEGDQEQAYALIRRMWFDRFEIVEDAPLAEAEARWLEQFSALRGAGFEEAAHALGLLVGLPFNDSPYIGAMRYDPAQVLGRAIVVSRELLASVRMRMPIVVLLEDLHWVDAASWDYLNQVIVQGPHGEQALIVIGTSRPEWQPPENLIEHPHYQQVELTSLSDAASRELARQLLQRVEGISDAAIQLIVKRSEGVPYFAEEMVNWFIDHGIIDRQTEPWRFVAERLEAAPLPATLQHLLLTRLVSLPDQERSVLQLGSIFGRHFWSSGLQALGTDPAPAVLKQLELRAFVEAQPESSFKGEREWSFHHSLLQEVTYESVLKRERKQLHKAAAVWLEEQARRAGRLDEFVGLLGRHAEYAGEVSAAADWYVRAGELAKARGATREALSFFDQALALVPLGDHLRRWPAALGRSDVLSSFGEPEVYLSSVKALQRLAHELDEDRHAEAHYREGAYLEKTGDYRAAVLVYQMAVEAARRAGNDRVEALSLGAKVLCQSRLGDLAQATASAEEAVSCAQAVDEVTSAKVLSNVAGYYAEAGDLTRATQLHREQVAIAHRLGDRGIEGNGLLNLGYDYVLLGLYELSRSALEQALEMLEAIGARHTAAYARLNLGLAYLRSGDHAMARSILEQAQNNLITMGDTFASAASLSYMALVLEQSEDSAGAMQRFAEANEFFSSAGARGFAIDALAGLARCALVAGDRNAARKHINGVWEYLQQHGTQGMEFPIRAYQTCAEIFGLLGELEESRAAIEEGYRDLIRRAEQISHLEWGKSFLANVPEHRAIIDLWDRIVEVAAIYPESNHQEKDHAEGKTTAQ